MARANDIMLQLKANLKLELPTFVLTDGVDASGNPTLTVTADATPATTEENAFIRIQPRTYVGFPTASLASSVDGRSNVMDVALEESSISGVSVWSALNLTKLMARIKEANVETNVFLSAATVVPVLATVNDSTKLKGSVRTDARHPNAGM